MSDTERIAALEDAVLGLDAGLMSVTDAVAQITR
jgi:hypothetical protein